MPIAAAIPAIIGGVSAIAGGIGGASNTRPPSLDKTQSMTLDNLIKTLSPTVGATPTIDPALRASAFNDIAAGGVGGANRVTNALASRGLGRSGLLSSALAQNSNQVSANQNSANQFLSNQAIQQRNTTINQILQLLGVNNTPGQSGFGGFMSGFAGPFAKTLASLNGGGSSGGGGTFTTPGGWNSGSS